MTAVQVNLYSTGLNEAFSCEEQDGNVVVCTGESREGKTGKKSVSHIFD